jgi:hypothetical protein
VVSASTREVTLPSNSLLKPVRLCDAMAIRSQPRFLRHLDNGFGRLEIFHVDRLVGDARFTREVSGGGQNFRACAAAIFFIGLDRVARIVGVSRHLDDGPQFGAVRIVT